ncbi:MAG TPA: oxidoreductase [Terriglobales bacterium]|nr:oxidoreductase [Terriglobales bacterium]
MNRERVALVTGVSSGIGRAIATLLSAQGFRVFGTVRHLPEPGPESSHIEFVRLEVRDEPSIASAVRFVLDQAGRIDALINNAGYALIGALEETSLEEARDLFETNFFGVLRLTQAVLPLMRKQKYGRIVNIGSAAGFIPAPYQGIYSASKHALVGYSESLDHEVRQFGIRISVVEPGFTRTNINKNAHLADHLIADYAADRDHVIQTLREKNANGADPAQVASAVLHALTSSSPRQVYLAGKNARLISLLRKFAPAGVFDKGLRKQFGLAGV